jgi:hypothetical protein
MPALDDRRFMQHEIETLIGARLLGALSQLDSSRLRTLLESERARLSAQAPTS